MTDDARRAGRSPTTDGQARQAVLPAPGGPEELPPLPPFRRDALLGNGVHASRPSTNASVEQDAAPAHLLDPDSNAPTTFAADCPVTSQFATDTGWAADAPEPGRHAISTRQSVFAARRAFFRAHSIPIAVAALLVGAMALLVFVLWGSSGGLQSTSSAVLSDLQSGSYTQLCSLAAPRATATCHSDLNQLATRNIVYKGLALGTETVSGSRALVVITGTVCEGTGPCVSNHDGNAAFDKGQTFDDAWTTATGANSSDAWVLPFVEQNGTWYVTGF